MLALRCVLQHATQHVPLLPLPCFCSKAPITTSAGCWPCAHSRQQRQSGWPQKGRSLWQAPRCSRLVRAAPCCGEPRRAAPRCAVAGTATSLPGAPADLATPSPPSSQATKMGRVWARAPRPRARSQLSSFSPSTAANIWSRRWPACSRCTAAAPTTGAQAAGGPCAVCAGTQREWRVQYNGGGGGGGGGGGWWGVCGGVCVGWVGGWGGGVVCVCGWGGGGRGGGGGGRAAPAARDVCLARAYGVFPASGAACLAAGLSPLPVLSANACAGASFPST